MERFHANDQTSVKSPCCCDRLWQLIYQSNLCQSERNLISYQSGNAPEAAQISPTSLEQFQITQLFTPASKMQSEEPFLAIARSTQPSNRTEEAKHLATVTRQARADYIRTITSWLQEVMPSSADEWVFAGGTTGNSQCHTSLEVRSFAIRS